MSNIKLFESRQIRSVWNETEEKWYFSVQDVVEILTESSDVKQYVKRMLSRDEQLKINWGTICTHPYKNIVSKEKLSCTYSPIKSSHHSFRHSIYNWGRV